MTPSIAPVSPRLPARVIASGEHIGRMLSAAASAPLDLVIRLWLAQGFVLSAILKLTDWNTAILLATYEYPVSWMSPAQAAWTGVGVELIGGLLLAVGLATRPAALALAALTLVVHVEYRELNSNLYTIGLLLSLALTGARGLSLDQLLGKGMGDSALPGGLLLHRAYALLDRHALPLVYLLQRLLVALVLLTALGQLAPQLLASASYDPQPLAAWFGRITFLDPGDGSPLLQTAAVGGVLRGLLVAAALLLAAGLVTRIATLLALLCLLSIALQGELAPLVSSELTFLASLLLLILVHGPGVLATDEWLKRGLQGQQGPLPAIDPALPHVVVVGAGFGGLAVVAGLRRSRCRITLVDQHNYHLFQPLLYQVATAGLSPADIATPVREHLRDQDNVSVRMARVTGVDSASRELILGERRLRYDYLVLATGARHSYFGKDAWEPHAPGLKRIEDSIEVRRRLLLAFEMAETASTDAERTAWMNFVIVGAGPTGVELAGAIAELARHGMSGEFRQIDPAQARVILVQSAERVLPSFPVSLSAATQRSLTALGVDVRLNSRVEAIDAQGVTVSGLRIPARTVLWAAGVAASPAAEWLGVAADKAGRIQVGPDLGVPGLPAVYAIGDTVASDAWNGQPVPGLAPAAKQGGAYVARVIDAQLRDKPKPPHFRYQHMGSLATIGRKSAVADFGFVRLSGPLAWWFWGAVHVLFLASLRSRVAVAFEWMWAYLTFRRSTRLITGKVD